MFVIEDELHAEQIGEYQTQPEAMAELRRLSHVAWDAAPNLAPCQSWRTCGRHYELIECDLGAGAGHELDRRLMLKVSSAGVVWVD